MSLGSLEQRGSEGSPAHGSSIRESSLDQTIRSSRPKPVQLKGEKAPSGENLGPLLVTGLNRELEGASPQTESWSWGAIRSLLAENRAKSPMESLAPEYTAKGVSAK